MSIFRFVQWPAARTSRPHLDTDARGTLLDTIQGKPEIRAEEIDELCTRDGRLTCGSWWALEDLNL